LSKTDCVRAFQLANSVGNSDADVHEMDLEEFCQCLLFLAKLAGFLGEGDDVPMASHCTSAAAESVSKLLTFLGCIVPEVGNRSSRNLARMKRQGSKGKMDAAASSPNRTLPPFPLGRMECNDSAVAFGSGPSVDTGFVKEVELFDLPQFPSAAVSARSPANEPGGSPKADVTEHSYVKRDGDAYGLSGNSDAVLGDVAAHQTLSSNGSLEKVAISALQSDFREMNLLPEQKWSHFASCLAQAGVNTLQDLLHLGSEADVLVKFLGDTCGMNVIQGKKVVAFLKTS
jgi:hypothetical protein